MKKFTQFISESSLDENEKLVKKLEKTRTSMHNHWKRGGEARHAHGRRLIYRYNDLASKLRETEAGEKHWRKYCDKHNSARDHAGHDFYA